MKEHSQDRHIKESKEFKEIFEAIDKWAEKHKNNVQFVGGFIAFDDKDDFVEDRILGYGVKKVIQVSLEELQKRIKSEKSDFVNW